MPFDNRISLQLSRPVGLILLALLAVQTALLAWILFGSPRAGEANRRFVAPCFQEFQVNPDQPQQHQPCLRQPVHSYWKV